MCLLEVLEVGERLLEAYLIFNGEYQQASLRECRRSLLLMVRMIITAKSSAPTMPTSRPSELTAFETEIRAIVMMDCVMMTIV